MDLNDSPDPGAIEKYGQRYEKDRIRKEEKRRRDKERRAKLRALSSLLTDADLIDTMKARLPNWNWHKDTSPQGLGRQRVDVWGMNDNKDYLVFIEVERNRSASIFNVAKAWQYIEKTNSKPVLLIQLFSPYYHSTGILKTRMNQAIFIGAKAMSVTKSKLIYKSLGPDYWPDTKGHAAKMIDALVSFIS